MTDTELCFHSIEELAPKLHSGEVSPIEVVEALLGRIEQYNDSLIAYLHVDVDRARAAAQAAEIEISGGGYRGPLHGIPVAYKDICIAPGSLDTSLSHAAGLSDIAVCHA